MHAKSVVLTLVLTIAMMGLLAPGGPSAPAVRMEEDAPPAVAAPEATRWLEAAATGEPLALAVGGEVLALRLAEDASFLAHAPPVIDATGMLVAADDIVFLRGHVEDMPEARIVAAVQGENVWATSLGPLRQFYVLPSADGPQAFLLDRLVGPGYGGLIHPEHALGGLLEAHEGEDGGDAPDCLSIIPEPADPVGLALGWSARTYDVAFAIDGLFASLYPDWPVIVAHFVQVVDAIYEDAIDLSVSPVHIIVIPDDALPSVTTSGTITELKAYYDTHYADLERESVYLFSAQEFSNAGGQAGCIGGAGYANDGYAVGSTEWNGPYSFTGLETLLPDKPTKIAAHELGHLLTAHHHHANCAETAPGYDPLVTLDVCTIMINDWGLIHPTFSSLNRLVMRQHADAVDL